MSRERLPDRRPNATETIAWAEHIEAVARRICGDPNPRLSTPDQLRFGTHGSLSVEIRGTKAGTWFDHERKVGGGVLDLIRHRLGLANGAAVEWLEQEFGLGTRESIGRRRIVAEYDYTDEDGQVLFQCVRFEPKKFAQRRPDGKGGWEWSLRGVRLVLYRLPAVLRAGDSPVYIVEGEKDADTLTRLGLVATCNPMGAGKWRPEFAQALQGADVVVIPDNDDVGRKHAEQIIRSLAGVARRVRRLDLPGLPEKGDVSDWIESGGTIAELQRLAAVAETVSHAPPARCLSVADWLARDIPTPDFLLGEWLSTTSRAMLVAPTGIGKTNLCMAIAFAMAAGAPFLHWRAVRPARVLYIDGEMSRRLMKVRLADAARRFGSVPPGLSVLCRDDYEDMPPLNTPEGQAFVDRIIEDLGGVDFVFFDNVMSLLFGDMKDEESWSETLPWAKSLTRRSIGQLWVHHTGHDELRAYGTKTREWQLDTVILLKRVEDKTADVAFELSFTKSRERTPYNRDDFATVTIRLAEDRWQGEFAELKRRGKPPSPKALAFHRALLDALAAHGKQRPEAAGRVSVTTSEWRAECIRLGLIDDDADDARARKSGNVLFRKYRLELIAAGWVATNGDVSWSLSA